MILGIFFAFWRFLEIVTLVRFLLPPPKLSALQRKSTDPIRQIPILGMLAWLVHIYAGHNALTPNYILILFIVSVLGTAWAIFTLFSYHRSRSNAHFVALIDLCFVGALIASVYELRFIAHQSCSSVTSAPWAISFDGFGVYAPGFHVSVNKTCSILKASFALGIMNCIFFVFTAFLAYFIGDRKEKEVVVVEETHYSRHGHRRGSHRSHRSSHSGRHHRGQV
jgi:hypothetical protein